MTAVSVSSQSDQEPIGLDQPLEPQDNPNKSISHVQQVIPALRVRSYQASIAFYCKLGFIEHWRHQFNPTFPVFASIALDRMEIFLTEHEGDCQFGGLVHFYVPDVDKCYRAFQQAGVSIAAPPSNSLGPDLRDMLVIDPDGNRLIFLTRSPNADS